MKHMIVCLLGLFLTTSLLSQGEDPQLRKEMEAVYLKWDTLAQKGDLKGLLAMIHPSFVQIDEDGKRTNYAQFKKELTEILKMIREIKSHTVVHHVYGNREECYAWVTTKASFKMKQGEKWQTVSFTMHAAETLKRTPKGWQFVLSQSLPKESVIGQ
ncbi:MAG TPA: nuclear transport factor 2 family protein [Fimbriimonadales bacterium]|nr:nuclear transport factor 2 family protein [Fimbriimonadales bacterium]